MWKFEDRESRNWFSEEVSVELAREEESFDFL